MKILIKLDEIMGKFLNYFCFALFLAIVVVGAVQVGGRYIFNKTIFWGEEIMRLCCIWLTMIGSAIAVRTDHHVAVDLLQESISNPKIKMILFIITRGLCMVFLAILFPAAIELVKNSTHSMAATINMSFAWVYLSLPVGFGFMLLSYIGAIARYARRLAAGEAIHEVGDQD